MTALILNRQQLQQQLVQTLEVGEREKSVHGCALYDDMGSCAYL